MQFSRRKLLPLCLSVSLLPAVALADTTGTSFTSPEHVMIGNQVKLHFSSGDPGQSGSPLHLSNGLTATYGDIVTMADFYGIPDKAVSQGRSEPERRAIFLDGYNSFAINHDAVNEATQLLAAIHNEQKEVDEGIEKGQKPDEIYTKMGHEYDRQYNCVTGGGCDINTWWLTPGRYLSLANGNSNYDHFGENAVIAYKVGHQLALEEAAHAHKTGDLKMLESAYAMNAFACHFLTDRFASGHIRTPRLELSEHSTPATAGSLLASYMHDEENTSGLHVHNLRGDHWVAYGDKTYFNPETSTHLKIVQEAMQQSADAIFAAFQSGTTLVTDTVNDYIPQADETGNAANLDISPLFYWDNVTHKLMRRNNMSNYYDKNWTDNWWAWSTLIELKRERGLTDEAQAVLARSEFRKQAVQSGLITNKHFIAYIKAY